MDDVKTTLGILQNYLIALATKNILYVTVNSRAYSEDVLDPGLPTWQVIQYVATVAAVLLLVLWEVLLIKSYKKNIKKVVTEESVPTDKK